jgi:zinc protease
MAFMSSRLPLTLGVVLSLPWSTPPPAQAQAAQGEQRFSLRNGLGVVLAPDPRERDLCVLVRYAVGSRDDPRGYRGLAHLAEHMVLRAGNTFEQLEDVGVRDSNGITTPDETYYYAVASPAALPRVLWLLASHMAFAAADVDAAGLEREREVVLHEWRERTEGEASVLIAESLSAALYPAGHPYALPLDRPDDVRAAGVRELQWFLQTYYGPAHATVIVAGNFQPATARDLIERYFAPIPDARGGPVRAAVPPSNLAAPREITHRRRVSAPSLHWAWPIPGRASAELSALRVLAGLLSSELERVLVAEAGPALAAEAYVQTREHESLFVVHVTARDEAQLPALTEQVAALTASLPGADALAIERALRAAESLGPSEGHSLVERAARLALPEQAPNTTALDRAALRSVAGKYLGTQRRVVVTMHTERDQ